MLRSECAATERRFLSDHPTENLCEDTYEMADSPATCDPHSHPRAHNLHLLLFAMSVTILSCFLIELLTLFVAVCSPVLL